MSFKTVVWITIGLTNTTNKRTPGVLVFTFKALFSTLCNFRVFISVCTGYHIGNSTSALLKWTSCLRLTSIYYVTFVKREKFENEEVVHHYLHVSYRHVKVEHGFCCNENFLKSYLELLDIRFLLKLMVVIMLFTGLSVFVVFARYRLLCIG